MKQHYYDLGFFDEFDQSDSIYCTDCRRILMDGEGYYQKDGKPYCEHCVESADLDDLIRICETNVDELYRAIGLAHGYVDGEYA
ncbi:MAG: hypothetical protein IKC59_08060 [Clostridia bacterium]|nr:hypothetical protein [Clostridia bacterium]